MVNKQQRVMTAVIIMTKTKRVEFVETTLVEFGPISDSWIDAYVDTGDPLNKAGGYGYQSLGGFLVKRIDGCFYNVVGFPLYRFSQELNNMLLS
jgi:predicted house-cleaning NTP pyrophosphatase (Maf/HAM1 superfamily)